MKRIKVLILFSLVCFLCYSGNSYAAWGGFVQTKEERKEAIKQAKEVDLKMLRERVKFLKPRVEELAAQGKKKLNTENPIMQSIYLVLVKMNEIANDTGFPIEVNTTGYTFANAIPAPTIRHVIQKLDEVLALIDSVIGPEQKTENTQGK